MPAVEGLNSPAEVNRYDTGTFEQLIVTDVRKSAFLPVVHPPVTTTSIVRLCCPRAHTAIMKERTTPHPLGD